MLGPSSCDLLERQIRKFSPRLVAVGTPEVAKALKATRYVQSHTRSDSYGRSRPPRYDGVAITWFDSTAAMRMSAASG